ncbi:MAG: M20/M25/M40 family metallo-hydrolase [Deltaproteobacteria bacterium]|nr:M20/M25/M40 family metallo-hydrolase [Deltaproteobacteria bacterium]
MVNRDRLAETFKTLAGIDSVSRSEGEISKEIQNIFESLGADTWIDDAGDKIGGETGNLIVKFKGNTKTAPILFNAHMDTVEPGKAVKVELNEGIFTSDGQTILGADDKSGIAILIEAMRTVQEKNLPFGPVEMVFTVSEEIGILGAKHFDAGCIESKYGFALDDGDMDCIVTNSPEAIQFQIKVHGKDSHAGAEPEKGINAIQIAGKAIAQIQTGRIDDESTCNIGLIEGGMATNIVPNLVIVKGEVRSHNRKKLKAIFEDIIAAFKDAVKNAENSTEDSLPRMEVDTEKEFPLTDIPESHPVVKLARKAAENLGRKIDLKKSGGGSDANIFIEKGIVLGVLGTGMRDMHTVRESIRLDDMVKTVELIIEVIRVHTARSGMNS